MLDNLHLLDVSESKYVFKSVIGTLKFQDLDLSGDILPFESYISTITIQSITLFNIEISDPIITFSLTDIEIMDLQVENITDLSGSAAVVSGLIESSISVTNLKYTNSTAAIFQFVDLDADIQNVTISNIQSGESLISIFD